MPKNTPYFDTWGKGQFIVKTHYYLLPHLFVILKNFHCMAVGKGLSVIYDTALI